MEITKGEAPVSFDRTDQITRNTSLAATTIMSIPFKPNKNTVSVARRGRPGEDLRRAGPAREAAGSSTVAGGSPTVSSGMGAPSVTRRQQHHHQQCVEAKSPARGAHGSTALDHLCTAAAVVPNLIRPGIE